MCVSVKEHRPMPWGFSRVMQEQPWNMCISQAMLANGMRNHPSPVSTDMACAHMASDIGL